MEIVYSPGWLRFIGFAGAPTIPGTHAQVAAFGPYWSDQGFNLEPLRFIAGQFDDLAAKHVGAFAVLAEYLHPGAA